MTHVLSLPEVRTELIRHCGGDTHHGFFSWDSRYVLFGFWAWFSVMTFSMILIVEVWTSWIIVLNFQGSSSPSLPLDAKPTLVLSLLSW
jgi:hypothetical protein